MHPDSYSYENVRVNDKLGSIVFYGNSSPYDHRYQCASELSSSITNTPFIINNNTITPSKISFSTVSKLENTSKKNERVAIDSVGNLNIYGNKELRLHNSDVDSSYVSFSSHKDIPLPGYKIEMPPNTGSVGELFKITQSSNITETLPTVELEIIPEIIHTFIETEVNLLGKILRIPKKSSSGESNVLKEGMYLVKVEKPDGNSGFETATNWNSTVFPTQIKRIVDGKHSLTIELENPSLSSSSLGSKYHFRDSIKSRISLTTKLFNSQYNVNNSGTNLIEVNDEIGIEQGMYLVECSDPAIYGSITGLKIRVEGIENNAANNTHNIRLDTSSLAATSSSIITTYTFAYGQVSGFTGLTESTNSDGSKTFTFASPIGSGFSQDNPPEVIVNGEHKSPAIIEAGIDSNGKIGSLKLIDGGTGYKVYAESNLSSNERTETISIQKYIEVGWGGVDDNVIGRGSNPANSNTITISSIDDNKTIQVGMFLFHQTND